MRLALGIRYNGQAYQGWQSQLSGRTVQDKLEAALAQFAAQPISTLCAGRTDTGVHGLMQVVHFDTGRAHALLLGPRHQPLPAARHRGPMGAAGARPVPLPRQRATRRYLYVLSQSPVRPSLDAGRVGWTMHALDGDAMRAAAAVLVGGHDSAPSAPRPARRVRRSRTCAASRSRAARARCWHFEFEADAFLHHMIRNIMGCLVRIGRGDAPPEWMAEVLAARSRVVAAPTFSPAGLYSRPVVRRRLGPAAEATLQAGCV